MPATGRRIVVTGATGFLGGAIAHRLADAAGATVIATGRNVLRGQALQDSGIEFHAIDLVDSQAVDALVRHAHAVIHCAALSSPWGPRQAFVDANIVASRNVANACVAAGVARLVHVSTPGVYHDGRPHRGLREDTPLPAPVNAYVETKRIAEAEVLAAATAGGISTVVLRPRAIFGPGDTAILPRIAHALLRGRLRRIGNGEALVDMTYIDNAVDAALLAVHAPASCSGRVYNISNGEPVRIWNVIDELADGLGVQRPTGRVPLALAAAFASAMEAAYRLCGARSEPPLLRYGVELLGIDMTLDISRAREELGYQPRVCMQDALAYTFAAIARDRVAAHE